MKWKVRKKDGQMEKSEAIKGISLVLCSLTEDIVKEVKEKMENPKKKGG